MGMYLILVEAPELLCQSNLPMRWMNGEVRLAYCRWGITSRSSAPDLNFTPVEKKEGSLREETLKNRWEPAVVGRDEAPSEACEGSRPTL